MTLFRKIRNLVLILGLSILTAACATAPEQKMTSISDAGRAAYFVKDSSRELVVAVSPAGRTMRIGGTWGSLLGAGVDAVVNERYQERLEEVIDYDIGEMFTGRLETRLKDEITAELVEVAPPGAAGAASSPRQAQRERFENLHKRGLHQSLELQVEYGIFGPQGILAVKVDGDLYALPRGSTIWDNAIVASSDPILANMELGDPTRSVLAPSFTNPRFKAEEDAISQWTEQGGEVLRETLEHVVTGVVSATLVDLGLVDEPIGHYYLGKLALLREDIEKADQHFQRAIELEPNYVDAKNGRSVVLHYMDETSQAVRLAKSITVNHPEFAPAYFNLAYWYAESLNDPQQAAEYYQKALQLGMAPTSDIEKKIRKGEEALDE